MADLAKVVTSTLNLLNQFKASLAAPPTDSSPVDVPANPPDPLSVLHDAAKLLKAHTTKLSLLTINKPFTPSAISSVVKELSSSCLPAMMSAIQLCQPSLYTRTLHDEAQARVRRVFVEMEKKIYEVVSASKGGASEGAKKDSLASTGVLWEACDALIELKEMGLVGLVVQKAEQYRATLEDAFKELQEWAQEQPSDDEDDEFAGSEDDAQDIEVLFDWVKKLPKEHTELRGQVDASLKKLKLISMLYQALIKRRLKMFPVGGTTTTSPKHSYDSLCSRNLQRLDKLMDNLKSLPHRVDDLAIAFYDLDGSTANAALRTCCKLAMNAAAEASLSWESADDAFTDWLRKWVAAVQTDTGQTA